MWDVVHIPRVPIFHLYTDVNNMARKLHWDPIDEKDRAVKWNELDKKSKARLADLVNNKLEEPYGLGSLRSIEEFGKLSGIDLINKEIVDLDIATNNFAFTEINSSEKPFHEILSKNE